MARGGTGGGGTQDDSVKHLFDRIGGTIQQQVHTAAEKVRNELKGNLSNATVREKDNMVLAGAQLCQLQHEFHTNVTDGNSNPCENGTRERFSEVRGGECDSKIKGNKNKEGKNEGACAPFRRLHLCDQNLEHIEAEKITSTDNLLLDVCLAAQYEGKSIIENYPQDRNNEEGICTALARSFADIGDIIRGKDLYRGDDKEKKDKLEKKLKEYFQKIYEKLVEKNRQEATERYEGDDPEFFKLREDWWEANRKTVWKAITCKANDNDKYFRKTCGTGKSTYDKCHCNDGDVLTNFDYVPQYLRWFEEWAEVFCRKKKKKLPNVKTYCRGKNESDEPIYCSGNGYDCTESIYNIGKLVIGSHCTKCSVSCSLYESWIDNQKQEFLKQKNKYTKEIEKALKSKGASGNNRKKRGISSNNNYKGYDEQFYKELKEGGYGGVDKFLGLLSNETECKELQYDKENRVDFAENVEDDKTKNEEGTFYHSQYCKPCPVCGVIREGGRFNDRPEDASECQKKERVRRDTNKKTDIPFLFNEEKGNDIMEKLNPFCYASASATNKDKGIEDWKCSHYDEEDNECVMQNNGANAEGHSKIMTFIDFFNFWVGNLLKDAIKWRKQLKNCITNNPSTKCSNKCNRHCRCFKKWVEQKKEEWSQIKNHYEYEEHFGIWDPYKTLELNLELEYFPLIQEAYGDLKSVEQMKKIIDQNKSKLKLTKDDVNAIDILLDHDVKDAENCLSTHTNPCPEKNKAQPDGGPGARILEPVNRTPGEDLPDDSGDSDTEENENLEEDESTKKEDTSPKVNDVDVCGIVKTALENTTALKEACDLKYNKGKNYGWRCIPTEKPGEATGERGEGVAGKGGSDGAEAKIRRARDTSASEKSVQTTTSSSPTSSSGSICVPPRRRRLYVGKLHDMIGGESLVDLRDAFIKCAAIETFFAWYEFKKEKEIEKNEKKEADEKVAGTTSDDQEQKKLEEGKIPEEFKRQMFYTLGDYRDICVGVKDEAVRNALEKSVDNKTGGNSIKDISDKIKEILQKQSGTETSVKSPSNSGKTPQETWWDENAKHIWRGMVCALTYKDNDPNTGPRGTDGDKKPIQDENVRAAFFGDNSKPGNIPTLGNTLTPPGTTTGTYETEYNYDDVAIGGNTTEAIGKDAGQHAASGTKLKDFVKRPFFFRWLEEWADEFCRKQKHKLYIIEKGCKGVNGGKNCSGDGFNCDDESPKKEDIFETLKCPTCARHCRWYKKWIGRKRTEYDEQEKAYGGQKGKCKEGSGKAESDNGFCGKLEGDAATFLHNLGPCKTNNGEDKTDFDVKGDTFKYEKYCGPCSQFTVKCKRNGECIGDGKKVTCNDGKISAKYIQNKTDGNGNIEMRVSDDNPNGNKFENGDLKEACEKANIFEGIRKDKYKCGKVCGLDICTLEKDNNGEGKEHITVKELVKRWLETFFEDYNRINKKIKTYTENRHACKCIRTCVEKWVEKKREEWNNINNTYTDQNTKNSADTNNLKTFMEEMIPQMNLTNDKGKITKLCQLDGSTVCTETDFSKNENGTQNDIVLCLLKNLENKAKPESCPNAANVEEQSTCDDPPLSGENSLPLVVDDDDEPFEEEDQNPEEAKKMMPEICKSVVDIKTEKEEKETCDAVDPNSEKEKEELEDGEKEDKGEDAGSGAGPAAATEDSAEPSSQPPASPTVEPKKPPKKGRKRHIIPRYELDGPAVIPALASSTLAWSVGIGFVALSYWWLLKKKSKSSVDMLRVMEIPQNDYGIPTLKSKNRYIPYTSAQYRGKRYIYLEGDSGTDSGYTDHYSDITSSSESEFEEFDINDIYVPGSPKYKTLIEVVLEPSKRETNSGDTIPNSGNTIPNSDIPSDNTPTNKFTEEEWNELKHNFISNMLQNEKDDMPNNNINGTIPLNTQPKNLRDNMEEKPFITSIHDRNLYTGEEYSYNMSTNSGGNDLYSNVDSTSGKHGSYSDKNDTYSGTDLINDSLSANKHIDIYDEILKRKENELFVTEHHPKRTNTYSVAKNTNSDPIINQLDLFHKWLDRHRNMCEKWDKNKKKEELLDKLKEEWENETHSYNNIHSDNITSGNIPSNNIHSDIHPTDIPSGNKTLNTDVSIQIHMDNNPLDNNIYLDTYPDKYTVDNNPNLVGNINPVDSNTPNPKHVQIEMSVKNTQMMEEKYPIGDVWGI
ncbi:erythrocyte membrane protein 1, PfEMP1, putative [Plasmodium reichenowi]|uniref:Erythrocyte membrane protein 1, PfEMP1, putative n=1 Tax=Plasmodium reichenowi TaxID=5854 RepID=A0A2P9DBL5_PLARE|nr:erythrocyte membrane protein 1, PfEMP1, putative [Plasmodium reichenowi]